MIIGTSICDSNFVFGLQFYLIIVFNVSPFIGVPHLLMTTPKTIENDTVCLERQRVREGDEVHTNYVDNMCSIMLVVAKQTKSRIILLCQT